LFYASEMNFYFYATVLTINHENVMAAHIGSIVYYKVWW